MDLFASHDTLTPIPLREGELALLGQLAFGLDNATLLARLIDETPWREETITLWGKSHRQPRLCAWRGDARYRYSGLTLAPTPMSALERELQAAAEAVTGRRFNSLLLNYYRDERDSMGMHCDDEPELGIEPAIASLSFGATRTLIVEHKRSGERLKLALTDGSLLLMSGAMQANWRHGINKERGPLGPRVNLTFRFIA
jgi:alkylated DNA repair dioxygenase AlkB